MLVVAFAIALLFLSLLGQRPMASWLKVRGPVRPLWPLARETSGSKQVLVRSAGLAVTLVLVVGVGFVQFSRELVVSARVDVVPGLAAAEGGLERGDLVVAVDGVEVGSFAGMREALLGGNDVKVLTVERGGVRLEKRVTLRDGLLGVKPMGGPVPTSSGAAFTSAWRLLFRLPAVMASRTSSMAFGWAALSVAQAWWATLFIEAIALIAAGIFGGRTETG